MSAGSAKFSIQATFAQNLSDTLTTGIGNLVDANMAQESASLQSLQVKQQLGVQALSIANQAPQAVLSLFQGALIKLGERPKRSVRSRSFAYRVTAKMRHRPPGCVGTFLVGAERAGDAGGHRPSLFL